MSEERKRVLVVEDSLTVRKRIIEALSADPSLEVVAEAADGAAGIKACDRLRPDVVTLDMALPELDGLAMTEHVMANFPTPILIVSASTERREVFRTFDALAAGAVEVLEKPRGTPADEDWDDRLRVLVRRVAKVRVIRHPRARLRRPIQIPGPSGGPHLVAIGGSTGAPRAMARLLADLPRDFALPILLVVHLNEGFAPGMIDWLGSQTRMRVRAAVDGDPVPEAGERTLIVAPPGKHLVVTTDRLRLTSTEERNYCRPSVDVLFESLVTAGLARRSVALLLSGMGRDGAVGLRGLRDAGAVTLVQDEATSVVWGMPGEAVALGAASRTLEVGEIGAVLGELAPARGGAAR